MPPIILTTEQMLITEQLNQIEHICGVTFEYFTDLHPGIVEIPPVVMARVIDARKLIEEAREAFMEGIK